MEKGGERMKKIVSLSLSIVMYLFSSSVVAEASMVETSDDSLFRLQRLLGLRPLMQDSRMAGL